MDSNGPHPPALIVGFHGYGIDASQIATLMAMAPDFNHVYLAPQGFHELDDGTRGWFPIQIVDGQPAIDPADLESALNRLAGYLTAAVEQTQTDPSRVYVVGYSQGGVLAITMAMARPQTARAFVGFAGSIRDEAWGLIAPREDLAATQLFIGHGTLDGFTPMESITIGTERLSDAGLHVELTAYRVPHVVSGAQRRDMQAWLERLDATVFDRR
ncbi:MAG: dienelactone hydrolase family protein [Planctomycetota bacterium]